MADDKNLKDDHGKMSDDDLYLKMVMLYQVEDPEAWEVAKHLQQRGTLDKPRMTDVEHIMNSPAPHKPTKAEALLARIYDEGYADAERAQQKMIKDRITATELKRDQVKDQLQAGKDDPAKAVQLATQIARHDAEINRLQKANDDIQLAIRKKLAAAGKGVSKVSPKGRHV